jgi:hypothetical protein
LSFPQAKTEKTTANVAKTIVAITIGSQIALKIKRRTKCEAKQKKDFQIVFSC